MKLKEIICKFKQGYLQLCDGCEEKKECKEAISQIRKELADRLIALNQFDSGSEKNLGFCVGIGKALKVVADFCEE